MPIVKMLTGNPVHAPLFSFEAHYTIPLSLSLHTVIVFSCTKTGFSYASLKSFPNILSRLSLSVLWIYLYYLRIFYLIHFTTCNSLLKSALPFSLSCTLHCYFMIFLCIASLKKGISLSNPLHYQFTFHNTCISIADNKIPS